MELCEYFIKTYTDEGAVVADICAGSGTTAVAAMNTRRRFICFENAPSIYTIAAQRIEQARLAVDRGGKGTQSCSKFAVEFYSRMGYTIGERS